MPYIFLVKIKITPFIFIVILKKKSNASFIFIISLSHFIKIMLNCFTLYHSIFFFKIKLDYIL